MKSRVFWNCLMNESILVQELHLPPSGLARLEEFVPIPKFIDFKPPAFVMTRFSSSSEVDDSYFQYHFLAQVAHRIILTRIRHSLYFYCQSSIAPALSTITNKPHSRLRNLPPPRHKHRTPPPTRTMANQPTPCNPIPRFTSKHARRSHTLLARPSNRSPSPLNTRHSSHRGDAPRTIHDRQIPHRQTIPIQSVATTQRAHRRRPGTSPQWSAECDGLAHCAGYFPANEELCTDSVCVLFAVCIPSLRFTRLFLFSTGSVLTN